MTDNETQKAIDRAFRPFLYVAMVFGVVCAVGLFVLNCAHSQPVQSTADLQVECLKGGGVFRVKYADYAQGWTADEAECWVGIDAKSLVQGKLFESAPAEKPSTDERSAGE